MARTDRAEYFDIGLSSDAFMLPEEMRYHLLKYLEENPDASQRQLARELGVSLGKVNYCIKALIQKGLVKAGNFKNSPKKTAYTYLLTPKGAEEKAAITVRFLKRKLEEYRVLEKEIDELRREAAVLRTKEEVCSEKLDIGDSG